MAKRKSRFEAHELRQTSVDGHFAYGVVFESSWINTMPDAEETLVCVGKWLGFPTMLTYNLDVDKSCPACAPVHSPYSPRCVLYGGEGEVSETWESWARWLLKTLLALNDGAQSCQREVCSTHVHFTVKPDRCWESCHTTIKRTAKPGWNEILHENAYTPVQNWRHVEKDYDPVGQWMTSTCSYKGNQTLWPNNSFLSYKWFTT